MNKKKLYICISFILVIAVIIVLSKTDEQSIEKNYKNISDLQQLDLPNVLMQADETYYLYFYKSECSYCVEVESTILQLAKEKTVYALNCDIEENRGKKYDWSNSIHELIPIGHINNEGKKVFNDTESEEKYLNYDQKNKYGKKNYYKIDSMQDINGGERELIYAKMVTPEIDYSIVEKYNDIIVAGVPTLLYVKEGKIVEFYFDVPDINTINLK